MRRAKLVIAVATTGSVAFSGVAGAEETLPFALELWDNAARAAMPTGLRIWLGFLLMTFLSSLFFVRHHAAARWAIAGFVASHVIVFSIDASGLAVVRRGLVSLFHVLCWAPALPLLVISALRDADYPRYRVWCGVLVAVIAIAFIFDLRDTASYLYHAVNEHPALAG